MATLYDGVPVFAPVAGNTALAADQVTLQAKLILGLEARTQMLGAAWGHAQPAGSNWAFQCDAGTADPPMWEDPTCTALDSLIVPIPLRDKEYLTDIYVLYSGAGGAAGGGEIGLYKNVLGFSAGPPATAAAKVQILDLAGANPWNTGGVVTVAGNGVGINMTADMAGGEETYFLWIQSHSAGGVSHARYYGTKIVTRFHVGA